MMRRAGVSAFLAALILSGCASGDGDRNASLGDLVALPLGVLAATVMAGAGAGAGAEAETGSIEPAARLPISVDPVATDGVRKEDYRARSIEVVGNKVTFVTDCEMIKGTRISIEPTTSMAHANLYRIVDLSFSGSKCGKEAEPTSIIAVVYRYQQAEGDPETIVTLRGFNADGSASNFKRHFTFTEASLAPSS
jgi:hypothetical protein